MVASVVNELQESTVYFWLTGSSETVEEAEPRPGSEQDGEMAEETTQLFIVLAKGVSVHHVETAVRNQATQLVGIYKVLPFAFENFNARFFVPAEIFHVLQHVRMGLNDHM